ncbi:MAG: SOS response-associated peptidase [Flavobacterium sp.]|nr:MAG: SOS response-associated peptidase [Flavobacterium sp.]
MCGRTLISESKDLAKRAGAELGGNAVECDTNRPPGTDMPVILDARPGKIHYIRWGLIPNLAKEPPKYTTTYCRIETMHNLPTFRDLIGRKHCVFVIDGFYEFDKRYTPSQPYYFQRKDKEILRVAGFWDTWKDTRTGIVIPSCSMIMQPANKLMGKIHDRMPCVLSQAESLVWLDREAGRSTRLSVLHPVAEDVLEGWQVDKKVNNARNKEENNPGQTGPQLDIF